MKTRLPSICKSANKWPAVSSPSGQTPGLTELGVRMPGPYRVLVPGLTIRQLSTQLISAVTLKAHAYLCKSMNNAVSDNLNKWAMQVTEDRTAKRHSVPRGGTWQSKRQTGTKEGAKEGPNAGWAGRTEQGRPWPPEPSCVFDGDVQA